VAGQLSSSQKRRGKRKERRRGKKTSIARFPSCCLAETRGTTPISEGKNFRSMEEGDSEELHLLQEGGKREELDEWEKPLMLKPVLLHAVRRGVALLGGRNLS